MSCETFRGEARSAICSRHLCHSYFCRRRDEMQMGEMAGHKCPGGRKAQQLPRALRSCDMRRRPEKEGAALSHEYPVRTAALSSRPWVWGKDGPFQPQRRPARPNRCRAQTRQARPKHRARRGCFRGAVSEVRWYGCCGVGSSGCGICAAALKGDGGHRKAACDGPAAV